MAEDKDASYISDGKGLKVYKMAYELATDLHRASLEFPKYEQYSLADQMRRASRSICANLVEGFDRQKYSKPEFKRFLMMASSSAAEVLVWLDFSLTFKYIALDQHKKWATDYDHVNRMLHRLRAKVS
jgi:four helix bundle protein